MMLFVTAATFASPSVQQASAPPQSAVADARSLVDAGKLDEAEELLRRHLVTEPRSPDGHFLLGYVLFRKIQEDARRERGSGHSQATREAAKASLAAYAEGSRYRDLSAFDLKIAALDQSLVGDLMSADQLLTRSVAANPSDAEAWYYLGRTKYTENRFEEAVHAFQQCLALEPRNVRAQDNLGLSYAGLGRADDATAAYEAAIAWQAQRTDLDAGPFLNLGTLFVEQNRPRDAVPPLLRAIEIAPGDARAHEQLGKAYGHLDESSRAQSELEIAVRLDPESAPLHFMLGQAYRKAGLIDKAKAEFARSAALNATPSAR
jgi:Flp pilus assembly protein TadD